MMRLLQRNDTGNFSLINVDDDENRPYAILSHRWLADTEEPSFEDLTKGTGEKKRGYEKIRFCGEQARQHGLQYFWVDTCCIDKKNYAELSHSINSMFRWYRNATRCYVHLWDVSTTEQNASDRLAEFTWESAFRISSWFTRGWTLQELLAPRSVEFFSKEGERLGDRCSLQQQIHEITNIPKAALQGASLSQFSVKTRFSWIQPRKTKVAEDQAYSLLGIFDVQIPLRYGEGMASAFKRLEDEIDKLDKCIQDLCLTDPCEDKDRIELDKGGLLRDLYNWILEKSDFKQWRNDQQSHLLWIKGDPGKGKTMLLCGIIDELINSTVDTANVSFFFCQAPDNRNNNATVVLRGLIYMLVKQQPSLISHVRNSYGGFRKQRFEGPNAWVALRKVFTNILEDPHLQSTYLIIDALDECTTELSLLLDLVIHTSMAYPFVNWIVSSRNWPNIEKILTKAPQRVIVSLELNEKSVSKAVQTYIQFRLDGLAKRNNYDDYTQDAVRRYLSKNGNDTFLWVALVCKELADVPGWEAEKVLMAFPPGLDAVYKRMLDQIHPRNAKLCKSILAVVSVVYRPITLDELASFVDMPPLSSSDYKVWEEIIGRCGSFLTLRDYTISFVHQSAKDFLLNEAFYEIFPSGIEAIHYLIFSRSLQVMSKTLRRDIYNLRVSGYPIKKVNHRDPLAASRYSCIYWINHLCARNSDSRVEHGVDLRDNSTVEIFVREKYIYWLEALSHCRGMSDGVVSMAKLEALLQSRQDSSTLLNLVHDARRFIMSFKRTIEQSPLQTYTALIFSPSHSLIRSLFREEEPKWISIMPSIGDNWNACLQTLEGHSRRVSSVAVSRDSTRLASASDDSTVKIWDISSGECLQTLEGHSKGVSSVAFSHDSTQLASVSVDSTVKIWDATSGECLQTLESYRGVSLVAFLHNSSRLASKSYDGTIKIWDTSSSKCLQTLKSHSRWVDSVTFSHDSTRLISTSFDSRFKIWDLPTSFDSTVEIWDTNSGECLQTLKVHSGRILSVAFSHDSTRLASASNDSTVKIWDISSGECLQTLEGHSEAISSVAFSHNLIRLASASYDNTIKIWDTSSGKCLQTLEGHCSYVSSVAFLYDSTLLVSASDDSTAKIWDTSSTNKCLQTFEDHSSFVYSVAFSHNSTQLASASDDCTIKIWDTGSSRCLRTLKGHSNSVTSVAFFYNSTRLVSASNDCTIKIWDTGSSRCLRTLKGHSDGIGLVAFSHDSTRLASASYDKTIKIWDTSSTKCLQTLEGSHSECVYSVAFSYNSTRLASASYDNIVKIWDISSGKCLQTLEGHSGGVYSLAFSHDSTRLASASDDSTVKIWDTSNGECLQTVEIGRALLKISFDPTGSYLHTSIGAIALTVPSSNLTSVAEPRSPQCYGCTLSSDGEWIIYNSENRVWIPSEYRPSCFAVSGNTIGFGVGNGKIWMCNFKVDNV